MNFSPSGEPRPAENNGMSKSGGVLDASVLLAALLGELEATEAEQWLAEACISAVNLSEVVTKLTDLGFAADFIADGLNELELDVRAFAGPQARSAGLLRSQTRPLGLSFGDRACVALAAELGRPAVTADRAWANLDIGVVIELVR